MKSPTDLIRKIALLQIGFVALVSEKVEEFIKELEEKGKLSEEEGKKFLKQLKEQLEKQKEELKC